MSTKPIDTIILGYGSQGKEHELAINKHPLFNLVAIIDPDTTIRHSSVNIFTSIEDATVNKGDTVIIATPPSEYEHLLPPLLSKGVHILLEKPIGISFDQSLEFQKSANDYSCYLQPAVQRRYHVTYKNIKKYKSLLGTVLEGSVTMHIVHRASTWRRASQKRGAGTLYDLGFHAIDLALALFGDLKLKQAVFFDENKKLYHGNTDAESVLIFENEIKMPIKIHLMRGATSKMEEVNIRGTLGTLTVNRSLIQFSDTNNNSTILEEHNSAWEEAMHEQLTAFFNGIKKHSPKSIENNFSVFDGIEAMRLIDLAYAYGKS
jgi:predicted dehydrogenase